LELDCVIENIIVPLLYYIPSMFGKNNFSKIVVEKLSLNCRSIDLSDWELKTKKSENLKRIVCITIVDKYV
jgi:CTP synthase (UTP-ammonia lyase)